LRLAVVVRDARDAITMHDLEGRILAWNPSAERLYGWREAEALKMSNHARVPVALRAQASAKLERLGRAEVLETYDTSLLAKDGAVLEVSVTATALVNEMGQVYAISTTEQLRDSSVSTAGRAQ
jgi:two-component system CheB/CheR fusion protein